jgi:hypothetical protein
MLRNVLGSFASAFVGRARWRIGTLDTLSRRELRRSCFHVPDGWHSDSPGVAAHSSAAVHTRASHFGFMAPGCLHVAWLHFRASAARAGNGIRMASRHRHALAGRRADRRFYLPLCISHGDKIPPHTPWHVQRVRDLTMRWS